MLTATGARVPGVALAEAIAAKLVCAVELSDTCAQAPDLVAAYGTETAELVRAHAPWVFYEEGMTALPVDYRECRESECSTGDQDGEVSETAAGEPVAAFIHVADCREPSDAAPNLDCSGTRAGKLYIQYWFYYVDSATLEGEGLQKELMKQAGRPGFHLDDWEGRVAPVWLAYVRVSRVGDRADTLISPDQQLERIRDYASRRRLEVEALEPELDVSGGRVQRPILEAAIRRVESGEAEGIIVAELDRLSRMSIRDALATIERIGDERVIAVAENFDVGTPEGVMARNVFLSVHQMYLDRSKVRFRAVKEQAVRRGIWPAPKAPIGYLRGPDRCLVTDPDTAPLVVRAFEERSRGAPWSVVADILGRGVSGAGKVIANRVYLGEVRLEVAGEDVVNPSAHEPLVTRAVWEAAQLEHPPPPRSGRPALLGGLVRCSGCKRTMTPDSEVYRCFARNAGGRCESPAIVSRRRLESLIERTFLALVGDISYRGVEDTSELKAASERAEQADAELRAYQLATSALDAEHFSEGMRSRVEAVEDARRDLATAQLRTQPTGIGGDVAALWPGLDVEGRRHLLRSALGVIWIRKGRPADVKVVTVKPGGLSRPGRHAGAIVPLEWVDLEGEISLAKEGG